MLLLELARALYVSVLFLLDSKVPDETCNQDSSGQQHLIQAYFLNLSPKPPFFSVSLLCFFYLNFFPIIPLTSQPQV